MKILFLLLCSLVLFASEKVLLHIDFKAIPDTKDATEILRKKGFEFELEKEAFHFYIKDEKLYIETDKKAAVLFGMILHGKKELKRPSHILIEWGVERFPKGSNWNDGNNRLPIGLVLLFGQEKLSSGMPPFIAPKVPRFFCPFIGEKEIVGKTYLGKLYKKGGRYYCVSNEGNGTLIKSDFEIANRYFKEFGKPVDSLSAFAFQVNTNNTKGGAEAFIKSVTLYGQE
jgi:hypothetical protein